MERYMLVYVCVCVQPTYPPWNSFAVRITRPEARNKTTTKNLSVNDWKNVFRGSHAEEKTKIVRAMKESIDSARILLKTQTSEV